MKGNRVNGEIGLQAEQPRASLYLNSQQYVIDTTLQYHSWQHKNEAIQCKADRVKLKQSDIPWMSIMSRLIATNYKQINISKTVCKLFL